MSTSSSSELAPSVGEAPPRWSASATSIVGADHLRRGVQSQDYASIHQIADGSITIVAVADGHGGDRHFRSAVGSRLGCEVFTEYVAEVAGPDGDWSASVARLLGEAPGELLERWHVRVREHVVANPFAPEDLGLRAAAESIGRRDADGAGEWTSLLIGGDDVRSMTARISAYGSTLLGLLVTPSHLWWFQLGDGNLVEASDEQGAQLLCEPHAKAFADSTPSLCSVGAERYVQCGARRFVRPTEPWLVAAVTDGFSNSFEHERGMLEFFTGALPLAHEHGPEAMHEFVPRWLSDMTQAGSGDDVTLAWALRSPDSPEGLR